MFDWNIYSNKSTQGESFVQLYKNVMYSWKLMLTVNPIQMVYESTLLFISTYIMYIFVIILQMELQKECFC